MITKTGGRMRILHPWLEDYEEWRRVREKEGLRHEYFVFVEEGDD